MGGSVIKDWPLLSVKCRHGHEDMGDSGASVVAVYIEVLPQRKAVTAA